ncbi:winged helix-turn-helix domain-containing protein [uncultured Lacinutrix sp.]|uniref:winged helix-turn-helix domain-containing protein n=1 Tax=uncultured Lacinutrix sp. TaxID=574032 RepID=UPI00263401C6|nr:winged helix-turn-helix domain-containing protein [uncultured Lacinutrix sp.]
MSKKKVYLYSSLIIILFFLGLFLSSRENNEGFTETVKVALREVGHQLLLTNKDTKSLILPVEELKPSEFLLSFNNSLSFEPISLVSIIQDSFQKSKLPNSYRVEVLQCIDGEVAYSYIVTVDEESTIIPCLGRFLPNSCYTIKVKFIKRTSSYLNLQTILYIIGLVILFIILDFFYTSKKQGIKQEENNIKYAAIGSFQFYPEQNKLVKAATEISLSKKECELLAIFVANPNQVIKRDELTKRVWEDNGVFVGRSLDTYISKLRKKLKDDDSIKLTNVHGVGYKLELN